MTANRAAKLLLASAFLASFAGGAAAQVKPHDYTKPNATLEKPELERKQSGLIDKRSSLREREFKPRDYTPRKDASALIEKSFYIDDKSAPFSPEKTFADSSKKFSTKEYSPKKKEWLAADKKQKLFDTEKDLTKTYKGKIDIAKRAAFDTDSLQNVYEQMQERSMQDINKYQFRHSHPTDPGIKTVRAGEQLTKPDSKSFLDTFSTRKKIEVDAPLVSMRGDKPPRSAAPKAAPSKPSPKAAPQSGIPAEKPKSGGKVQSIEYLDESKSGSYEFLRVPKGMKPKGRAVIKVETDD